MRTDYCGELSVSDINKTVTVAAWLHRRRDHGGVIFLDLRDRTGILQVVVNPNNASAFAVAEQLRSEYVVSVTGTLRVRPEGTENKEMSTGGVELLADTITLLNKAKTPPFLIDGDDPHDDIRLKYRYMDLRRPVMRDRLIRRSKIASYVRHYLESQRFLEIETPMLTKATPEGARDYLVPSRVYPGEFFALPQSPQQFKQLLMMAGFDRYYQIARCFRDEDLRADRQPEFTQIDIEMSFIDEEAIMTLVEKMICGLFKEVLSVDLLSPFPRLTYAEAMQRYGSDKPDLRNPLILVDIADLLKDTEFKVFREAALQPDTHRVAALRLPQGAVLSRKELDDYAQFVGIYGAKGLAYIKVNRRADGLEGLQSPILKFISASTLNAILDRVEAVDGDLVFFGADTYKIVSESLGALRIKLGHDRQLLQGEWAPLWVVDFPMFEWNADEKRWEALHHPFTAPSGEMSAVLKNPGKALSRAYDMVLNGYEIGGGSIRIHDSSMQAQVFDLLGISPEQAQLKFGFLLEALQYGCPPHGGLAFGLDRIAMLMSGAQTIREVIAFPKTQTSRCLLTGAPTLADEKQLRELGIRPRSA